MPGCGAVHCHLKNAPVDPAGPAGCGYTAGMNIFERPLFRVMCAGLLASAIVGCGNKGPLVLPAPPPAAQQPMAEPDAPAPASDVDDTDPLEH